MDGFLSAAEKGIRRLIDLIFDTDNESMIQRHIEDPGTVGMGTTFVMGLVRNSRLYVAWMGDSRCYIHRKALRLKIVSKDHTLVQMLVHKGEITIDQVFKQSRSNIIISSLPCSDGGDPMPEHAALKLEPGDRILFCSDGLNGMLHDREIGEILSKGKYTNTCADHLRICSQRERRKG